VGKNYFRLRLYSIILSAIFDPDIIGNEEGGFGWIAFNYLKKIIGPKKLPNSEEPYAVVEMGGASAQVSQMAPTLKDVRKTFQFSVCCHAP